VTRSYSLNFEEIKSHSPNATKKQIRKGINDFTSDSVYGLSIFELSKVNRYRIGPAINPATNTRTIPFRTGNFLDS